VPPPLTSYKYAHHHLETSCSSKWPQSKINQAETTTSAPSTARLAARAPPPASIAFARIVAREAP